MLLYDFFNTIDPNRPVGLADSGHSPCDLTFEFSGLQRRRRCGSAGTNGKGFHEMASNKPFSVLRVKIRMPPKPSVP
jgi:hypothetical protein